MNNKVAVLGTGAWATALSCCLADNNNNVYMWGIEEKQINDINNGFNTSFFGNQSFDKKLIASLDLSKVLDDANYILIAIPSSFIIDVLNKTKPFLNKNKKYIFINVAKGLDPNTQDVWSKSIYSAMEDYNIELVTLIGPSFAIDVFEKKPTVVNVVSRNILIATDVAKLFNCSYFKAVACDDEIGAQILSALKNLLAIAVGIARENHNSINTISAMLTQGINEMQLIAKQMGAKETTILDFCGVGDIFLTCTSDKSRNFTFGRQLYREGVSEVLKTNKTTIEGYKVYSIAKEIIKNKNLKTPVFNAIINVLDEKLSPKNFVDVSLDELMNARLEKIENKN